VLGLVTRLAVMPMIVDMLGALATTKCPLLWGVRPRCVRVSMVSGTSFTSPESSAPCCATASSCLPWGRGAGPWMPGVWQGVQEGRCPPLTRRHSRHFEVFMRGSDGYGFLGE
jgi:hypothetical protein